MKIINNVLCEIHRYEEDSFSVGEIIFINDNIIISKNIDPYGFYDGFRIEMLNFVSNISYNTDYINFLKKVRSNCVTELSLDSFDSFIENAINNDRLLSISKKRWRTIKIVKILSNKSGIVTAEIINQCGKVKKLVNFNIQEIKVLEYDTLELRTYEKFLGL